MNKGAKITLIIVGASVLIGGGYFLLRANKIKKNQFDFNCEAKGGMVVRSGKQCAYPQSV